MRKFKQLLNMANTVGRPKIMTSEVLFKLESAFATGASDKMACFLANISEAAFYKYQKENPEFLERKNYLKKQIKYQARQKVIDAILTEEKPDTAKWYLERRDKDFKPKSDITSDDEGLQQVLVKFLDGTEQNNRDTDGVQEAV